MALGSSNNNNARSNPKKKISKYKIPGLPNETFLATIFIKPKSLPMILYLPL